MQLIIQQIQKRKKAVLIGIFLIVTFLAGNTVFSPQSKQITGQKVLSASTHIVPTPTSIPTPTTIPVTIINNIYIPTPSTSSAFSTPTPTPTQVPATPTPTPSVVPTEAVFTPIPTTTSTPTPISQTITIDIDYAGEHTESVYTVAITSGESAWHAVQDGVGLANLQYTDYGGSLGIFITGFNGVNATSNQYYEFQVNGTSSDVGVSSYIVADHDIVKFVLTSY